MSVEPKERWHADRRIPIISLAGLILQTVAIVWMGATFMATTDFRLNSVEVWIGENKKITEDMAIMKVTQGYIKDVVTRIDNRLSNNK